MRALVTGGTGFIGSHLVDELLHEGHQVRVLRRPTSTMTYLQGKEVADSVGDLSDQSSLLHATKDIDVVFHVAALPRVVSAFAGKGTIIVDGGIRRGQDVFRALALGADVVALGRPVLYGMALGGAQGVQAVYARLKTELQMVMQLAGTANIKAITRGYIAKFEG